MRVWRRASSSRQHVKAMSLSVVILRTTTSFSIPESAARIVLRFLFGSFLTQVRLARRSTTTRSTHGESLETMKSISRCPNSLRVGRSSMYDRPSCICFQWLRFLPPFLLFQPRKKRLSYPRLSANLYIAFPEQTMPYSRSKKPLICFGDHFLLSFSSTVMVRKALSATFRHCCLARQRVAYDLCLAFFASYAPCTLFRLISLAMVFTLRLKSPAMLRTLEPLQYNVSITNRSSNDR